MKRFIIYSLFFIPLLSSCSSVDGDAKEAADLNRRSINHARDLELEKAEKCYKESREIVNKYKDTDRFEEFYTAYNKYMSESVGE